MFSLLKLLCAEYNCDAVELRKILIEKSDEVEALIRHARMVAMWKDCCYTVDFQGFSVYGAHAILCESHGVPIDVDFEYNEGVKLAHKKLHCVTSATATAARSSILLNSYTLPSAKNNYFVIQTVVVFSIGLGALVNL